MAAAAALSLRAINPNNLTSIASCCPLISLSPAAAAAGFQDGWNKLVVLGHSIVVVVEVYILWMS